MKTEVLVKSSETEKGAVKGTEEQRLGRGMRRSLHPLQLGAGDKENLVGGGRPNRAMPPNKSPHLLDSHKKQKTTKTEGSSSVTLEDLTEEEPSKAYWEALAEKRRLALGDALKENEELHQRVALLEEENQQCKLLLDEARALVETLTEILHSPEDEEQDMNTSECQE